MSEEDSASNVEALLRQVLGKLDQMDVRIKKLETELGEEKKEKPLSPLLSKDICLEVAKHVPESEGLAFALTCRGFRDAMKEVSRKEESDNGIAKGQWLKTSRKHYKKEGVPVSEEWIKWAFSMKWEYAKNKENEKNEAHKRSFIVYLAARGGFKDEVFGWLKSRGCAFDSDACKAAAGAGHVKVLEYLKSEGMAFGQDTCLSAAKGGHIEVLRYLSSVGTSLNENSGKTALEFFVDSLKCSMDKSSGVEKRIQITIMRKGPLEVIKYLRSEEGMRFDQEMLQHMYDEMGPKGEILTCVMTKMDPAPDFYWVEGDTKRRLTRFETAEVKSFLPMDREVDEDVVFDAFGLYP
jgi:hypothetical protein